MEQTIKSDKNIEESNILYTVAMRGLVAFPKMVMHFDVSRAKSISAIEHSLKEGGKLCDIVPTLIECMGLEKPAEMTGESLLIKK